jgi:hypothetical protein
MSASSGMTDLQVRHEPVDDLGGRLEGQLRQLGVDHGGLGIGVTQDLLDDAQIHPLFQEMGSPVFQRDKLRNVAGCGQRPFCAHGPWPMPP